MCARAHLTSRAAVTPPPITAACTTSVHSPPPSTPNEPTFRRELVEICKIFENVRTRTTTKCTRRRGHADQLAFAAFVRRIRPPLTIAHCCFDFGHEFVFVHMLSTAIHTLLMSSLNTCAHRSSVRADAHSPTILCQLTQLNLANIAVWHMCTNANKYVASINDALL